jgi:predicted ATP-binding protein involved in virulence
MIRFNHLKLHNFRCFEDCEVGFEPDLTVFIARNGQGKTAILDAVALTLGLFVDTISGTNTWKGFQKRDVRRIREGENTVVPTGFVQFEMDAEIDGHDLSWRRWMKTDATREITSKKDAKPLIGISEKIHNLLARNKESDELILPLVAYYGTGRRWYNGKERSARPFLNVVNERCLGYNDCLSGTASYSMFVDWYRRTFESLSPKDTSKGKLILNPTTGHVQANRPEVLLAAVNRAVETVLEPETDWGGLFWDTDDRQLILKHPIHGQLPLDYLSDGIRNTAALVADVAHRCARLNPQLEDAAKETAGILIIDEVDLHLHPEWQQRIVEMLRSAFPKLQLIFSTHSPQVLSSVYAKQIRVVRVVDGEASIKQPTFQTRGVVSADILAAIMGVDPVPKVEEAEWLSEYRAFIEQGQFGSDKALALRHKLISHFGEQHPLMLDCNRLIRFTQFKLKKNFEGGANAST